MSNVRVTLGVTRALSDGLKNKTTPSNRYAQNNYELEVFLSWCSYVLLYIISGGRAILFSNPSKLFGIVFKYNLHLNCKN